ncbi:hypothetical protein LMH87_001548 [Akanthomyces muscarius]|uniref:Uncharacterized protein n=1 Tax=Akanthomyces muscarius TaxID=2231603 RepID=A0A9W8UHN6_AKAMU|nr:hypothetical protein LMH87_001548 [Akanthomyces muscarius]KAJ4146995.1 hypothetical protein LMH87_001548 [Akanthomyces muscarius]
MAISNRDRALQLDSFFLPSGSTAHDQLQPKTNWLKEPEFPSPDEILSNSAPKLLCIDNADITSKQEYLEKHYRMQRYEAIEPTRFAVSEFCKNPTMGEGELAYIYSRVQMQGVVLTAHGAAHRASFSTDRCSDTPVDWANSGRLCQGSLVVLSPVEDAFRSKCLVAIVAYRFLLGGLWPNLDAEPPEPDDTPPRIDLYFSSWTEKLLDPNIKYFMLESKNGYFESFRHTMRALQTAASEKSLLDKYVLANSASEITTESPVVNLRSQTRNTLDKSQAAASRAIIGRELAIVQGPPGTGKTHTTVITIEEILRQFNPTKPIIVAAVTNHALDQLLQRCLLRDIVICRLGGRTVSETIEEHSLCKTRERNKGTVPGIGLPGAVYRDFETALQVLEFHLKKSFQGPLSYDAKLFRDAKIITAQQFDSLQDKDWETLAEVNPLLVWLGWEHFGTSSAEVSKAKLGEKWKANNKDKGKDDEEPKRRLPDPDKPIGPFIPLRECSDRPAARLKSMLARNRDLYKIKAQHREELFNYMCHELAKESQAKLQESFNKFQVACQRLQKHKIDRDNRVVARTGVQVLGCTITGLSKYRQLLSMIGPDVLIIDEASEATEGSIAAALLPSLKHLALIGDHQQLTPRPITQALTHPIFALDMSLFERLVTKNEMPYIILNMQRRMIPEIRQLVNLFYPDLRDHSSVMKREAVKGLGPALWWFSHAWPEQTNSGASGHSICNNEEADMIVHFARYLFRCGTPVEKLTILTFYTAQQELIQSKLSMHSLGSNICKTVDSFQGCENDVILLSVVRSPHPGRGPRVGFIENLHRATVALSRARNAFYIFGNAESLKGSATWDPVLDALGPLKEDRLPLVCPIHNTIAFIRCSEQWPSLSGEGGCRGQGCETDEGSENKIVSKIVGMQKAKTQIPERVVPLQRPFIPAKAALKLDKATLDSVDSATSRPRISVDRSSLASLSQDSTAHSSDDVIEMGYDAYLAEFEELAVSARYEMLRGQLLDLEKSEMDQVKEEVAVEVVEASRDLINFD